MKKRFLIGFLMLLGSMLAAEKWWTKEQIKEYYGDWTKEAKAVAECETWEEAEEIGRIYPLGRYFYSIDTLDEPPTKEMYLVVFFEDRITMVQHFKTEGVVEYYYKKN